MHVIGTAGHVDHGKSALVEALTGIDPDRFEEEKRRGLTIDLGFAWLALPSGEEIGLIDVPGHERFIKNMLAGAGGISICLFVVAANEGWMPQSAEHLAALEVLGITSGVVAVTKSDTVDPETLEVVLAEVKERISRSSLAGAAIVSCSAVTGEGLERLVAAIDAVVTATPPPQDRHRPRLWVDRVFTMAGAGTVVTGTLAGGSLRVGQEVEISPGGRRSRVRALQTHKKEVSEIPPGDRVALNLAGLERGKARRGDAVVEPGRWRATTRVDAAVRVLGADLVGRAHELTEKGAHLLYVGSAETPVRIKLLGTDHLASGESGFAQLHLRDPLPLQRGDRFVLRDAGRVLTFGGGEVLDPLPGAARRGDGRRLSLLEKLAVADPSESLAAIVEAEGAVDAEEAWLRSGTREPPPGVAELRGLLVSRTRLEELKEKVRAIVSEYHARHPLERGLPKEHARAATDLGPDAFDSLLALIDDVVEDGPIVRLASFSVSLAPEQERTRAELVDKIDAAGFTPPLAHELGVDEGLLRALVDGSELVRIGDFYLTAGRAAEARSVVRSKIEEAGPLTVAAIRDLLGTSRKYAVPLCEWLDATGATRRQGDLRVLGPSGP